MAMSALDSTFCLLAMPCDELCSGAVGRVDRQHSTASSLIVCDPYKRISTTSFALSLPLPATILVTSTVLFASARMSPVAPAITQSLRGPIHSKTRVPCSCGPSMGFNDSNTRLSRSSSRFPTSLPSELILEILLHLNARNLASVRRVSYIVASCSFGETPRD